MTDIDYNRGILPEDDGDELDEVMQHWIKQADEQEKVAEMYPEYADECKKISNDFRQLASWLKELKRLRIKYNNYKTDHGYMWICPDCGLMVHSDFKRCVRCGNERSDLS